jgi:hypothetical protein
VSVSRANRLGPEADLDLATCNSTEAGGGGGPADTARDPDSLLRRNEGMSLAMKSMAGLTIGIMMGSTRACLLKFESWMSYKQYG